MEAMGAVSGVMTTLLGGIASVSLIVGGIGIMNIMLVSVTERTREIGLRKSVGATSKNILTQFLIEAVVISVLGGAVGVLFGGGASVLIGKALSWKVAISPQTVGLAFGVASGVGLFFGIYPAKRAADLNPIDALRFE
jgi:putative ABC transport system permease protein